jgi:ABC-type Fe2+-enterobactin transport system substrate-binding protein
MKIKNKKASILIATGIASTSAYASQTQLSPGSSAVIEPGNESVEVYCKRDGETTGSYEEALKTINELKAQVQELRGQRGVRARFSEWWNTSHYSGGQSS